MFHGIIIDEIIYILIVILVCIRIIYDTHANSKALAYLLFVIFVPFIGIFVYFSFGVNYRKRKLYKKKLISDSILAKKVVDDLYQESKRAFEEGGKLLQDNKELTVMLLKDTRSPLTMNNRVTLLKNGENKFPEVLKAIKEAKHHVHIEYYIYEDDDIGKAVENALAEKAKEGVSVRFIYDDFGSRSIRRHLVPRLKAAGVKTTPFYRVRFWAFANRLNYRNHRKIVVIDGTIGFVGGINVSSRYVNNDAGEKQLYWRDTHLRIEGPGVQYLQYLFVNDWNFCTDDILLPDEYFFPKLNALSAKGNKIVQIAASGPDSDTPTILFSLLMVIYQARNEVLITTPYFIPTESILEALLAAALGGVSIKLLVPAVADSKVVNAAARSYYGELLAAGVEIYLYKKGFIHAKTLVADKKIGIVGTANIDYRSFDLNFEVNAIVYDKEFANELADDFYNDLKDADKIDRAAWDSRPAIKQFLEKTARLVSPLL
ncbi:MAG: cardiolipin synthase, partial [Saprospiraceae bacterium]